MPVVTTSGDVSYRVKLQSNNNLLGPEFTEGIVTVPSSEIIHDRAATLHHQFIGVPPVAASRWAVVKNTNILQSASEFFSNGANPGGILSAPAGISEANEKALRDYWDDNFKGDNSGKVAVIGKDVNFTPLTMKSTDAQLVDQLEYSDRQITQPFGIPPFLVGIGDLPAGMKVLDMERIYMRFGLQTHMQAMENLLTEGLNLPPDLTIELDTSTILRLDPEQKAGVYKTLHSAGIATPNEAREAFNFTPLNGGDTLFLQRQEIPIDAAAKAEPTVTGASNTNQQPTSEEETQRAIDLFDKSFEATV